MLPLCIKDIIITNVIVMDPSTVLADVANVIANNEQSAIIIRAESNWGYITLNDLSRTGQCAQDIANFDAVITSASCLDDIVENYPANLLRTPVLFEDDQKIVGISTPESLIDALLTQYHLQQARMTAVLDTVGESVCIIDPNNKVVVWNKRAERLYGIAADSILGNRIDNFFTNLLVKKALAEQLVVKDQYHKPCSSTHVLINAAPIFLKSEVVGGVSAERDITEVVTLNQELTRTSRKVQSLESQIDKINAGTDAFANVSGHSPGIVTAVSMARRVAATNAPLLIRGESGTGKEVFARAVHTASGRQGKFMEINCGAIPANLFESELFGYQSGAFTGADKKGKVGLIELADGGTVFLDEIGEMPKEMQVKLLRVLQEKSFYRVGGEKPIQVDVRIISATHRDLEEMIVTGDFREDLYYRLNVVTLYLPPLRDRREDIPELVYRKLKNFTANSNQEAVINKVDPALMAVFLEHDWPGNVRELNNILERLVILTDGDSLTTANLPPNFLTNGHHGKPIDKLPENAKLKTIPELSTLERLLIEQTLKEVNFNKAMAAKKLGIPRSTLYYKMHQFNLEDINVNK
ncbi:sigma 54-interacting transcriptional regulator [Sporomusa acidovorans]|uniref:Anaerobic nitric oxide reductase transcription regulator NorR n=1 Tax=Sporomusa acidovorans (strain ATCC 49682 / DSM 3132 / Mol) TaxID=1123286 RepID=A0ABZ3J499_SPOA4|nr:sigma 54-interacting transcriptional regulator [Sporomusa acidovorans]OZC20258.1 transcriptional regulatory protein ZraR [Sporomusa acidovorans DSM 3132]SDD40354.1 PAS domain S-box-containing protein [Sporomusa acidovorans]